jgi:hypothetical protein
LKKKLALLKVFKIKSNKKVIKELASLKKKADKP